VPKGVWVWTINPSIREARRQRPGRNGSDHIRIRRFQRKSRFKSPKNVLVFEMDRSRGGANNIWIGYVIRLPRYKRRQCRLVQCPLSNQLFQQGALRSLSPKKAIMPSREQRHFRPVRRGLTKLSKERNRKAHDGRQCIRSAESAQLYSSPA
jgi:hypothetical protein